MAVAFIHSFSVPENLPVLPPPSFFNFNHLKWDYFCNKLHTSVLNGVHFTLFNIFFMTQDNRCPEILIGLLL